MELEKVHLSRNLIKVILVETLRGKSLGRILINYTFSQFELSGKALDLGSGIGSPSYRRFMRYKEPFSITYSDYYGENENLVRINLEEPFTIEGESYDYVTCFSVLEHIYHFQNVVRESHRVLKKGGKFIGSTPFIHIFHPDPCDYFRYSHQALIRIFEEENYTCQRMIYLGFGPFSLAVSSWIGLVPKVLKLFFVLPAIYLDVLFSKFTKSPVMRYALNYFYVFQRD